MATRDHSIRVRVTAGEKAAIEGMARVMRRTVSDTIRLALERYVEAVDINLPEVSGEWGFAIIVDDETGGQLGRIDNKKGESSDD